MKSKKLVYKKIGMRNGLIKILNKNQNLHFNFNLNSISIQIPIPNKNLFC